MPKERLFDDGDYGLLDTNQIPTVKDQATFSLATVAMRSGRFEEAKEMFGSIQTPWASYYLSKVLLNYVCKSLFYIGFIIYTPTKVKHHPIFLSIYLFTSILLKQ